MNNKSFDPSTGVKHPGRWFFYGVSYSIPSISAFTQKLLAQRTTAPVIQKKTRVHTRQSQQLCWCHMRRFTESKCVTAKELRAKSEKACNMQQASEVTPQ